MSAALGSIQIKDPDKLKALACSLSASNVEHIANAEAFFSACAEEFLAALPSAYLERSNEFSTMPVRIAFIEEQWQKFVLNVLVEPVAGFVGEGHSPSDIELSLILHFPLYAQRRILRVIREAQPSAFGEILLHCPAAAFSYQRLGDVNNTNSVSTDDYFRALADTINDELKLGSSSSPTALTLLQLVTLVKSPYRNFIELFSLFELVTLQEQSRAVPLADLNLAQAVKAFGIDGRQAEPVTLASGIIPPPVSAGMLELLSRIWAARESKNFFAALPEKLVKHLALNEGDKDALIKEVRTLSFACPREFPELEPADTKELQGTAAAAATAAVPGRSRELVDQAVLSQILTAADELTESWRKRLGDANRYHPISDPIPCGVFDVPQNYGKKAEQIRKALLHASAYTLKKHRPWAAKLIDVVELDEDRRKGTSEATLRQCYPGHLIDVLELREKRLSQKKSWTHLKRDFPQHEMLINLLSLRDKLDEHIFAHARSIHGCFTELVNHPYVQALRSGRRKSDAKPVDEPSLFQTAFVVSWQWYFTEIDNPYALGGEQTARNEEDEEKAERYPYWIQRQIARVFEEQYEKLFAALLIRLPHAIYEPEQLVRFVHLDLPARREYVHLLARSFLSLVGNKPQAELLDQFKLFLRTIVSPFLCLRLLPETTLLRITSSLLNLTPAQEDLFPLDIRERVFEQWITENEERFFGTPANAGLIALLLTQEILEQSPQLGKSLLQQMAESDAESLRMLREELRLDPEMRASCEPDQLTKSIAILDNLAFALAILENLEHEHF